MSLMLLLTAFSTSSTGFQPIRNSWRKCSTIICGKKWKQSSLSSKIARRSISIWERLAREKRPSCRSRMIDKTSFFITLLGLTGSFSCWLQRFLKADSQFCKWLLSSVVTKPFCRQISPSLSNCSRVSLRKDLLDQLRLLLSVEKIYLARAMALKASRQLASLRQQTPRLASARVQVERCSMAFLQHLMASSQLCWFLQMLPRLLQAQLQRGLTSMALLYQSMASSVLFMRLQTIAMLQQAEWYWGLAAMHLLQYSRALSLLRISSQVMPVELCSLWMSLPSSLTRSQAFMQYLIDSSYFFLSQQDSPMQQQQQSSWMLYLVISSSIRSSLKLCSSKISLMFLWGALYSRSFSMALKYHSIAQSQFFFSQQLTPMLLQQEAYSGATYAHFLYQIIAWSYSFLVPPNTIPISFIARAYFGCSQLTRLSFSIFESGFLSLRASTNNPTRFVGSMLNILLATSIALGFSIRLYSQMQAIHSKGRTHPGLSSKTWLQRSIASSQIDFDPKMFANPNRNWQFLGWIPTIDLYHFMPGSMKSSLPFRDRQQSDSKSQGVPLQSPSRIPCEYHWGMNHQQYPMESSLLPRPSISSSGAPASSIYFYRRGSASGNLLLLKRR